MTLTESSPARTTILNGPFAEATAGGPCCAKAELASEKSSDAINPGAKRITVISSANERSPLRLRYISGEGFRRDVAARHDRDDRTVGRIDVTKTKSNSGRRDGAARLDDEPRVLEQPPDRAGDRFLAH